MYHYNTDSVHMHTQIYMYTCYQSVHSGHASETFLDQARCMAHVTHAYHLQHENLRTLMTALKQLNAAEEAQEDVHEV